VGPPHGGVTLRPFVWSQAFVRLDLSTSTRRPSPGGEAVLTFFSFHFRTIFFFFLWWPHAPDFFQAHKLAGSEGLATDYLRPQLVKKAPSWHFPFFPWLFEVHHPLFFRFPLRYTLWGFFCELHRAAKGTFFLIFFPQRHPNCALPVVFLLFEIVKNCVDLNNFSFMMFTACPFVPLPFLPGP